MSVLPKPPAALAGSRGRRSSAGSATPTQIGVDRERHGPRSRLGAQHRRHAHGARPMDAARDATAGDRELLVSHEPAAARAHRAREQHHRPEPAAERERHDARRARPGGTSDGVPRGPGADSRDCITSPGGLEHAVRTGTRCSKRRVCRWPSSREAVPRWVPLAYSDERKAWDGRLPERPDVPIRVEAAAFAGRPVFFVVTGSWDRSSRGPQAAVSRFTESMAAHCRLRDAGDDARRRRARPAADASEARRSRRARSARPRSPSSSRSPRGS